MENATIDSIYLLIESNEFSDEDLVDIIFNVHIDLDNFVENCSLLDDRPRLKEMIEKRREAFRKLADSRGNLSSKSIIEIPNNMFVGVELEYYGTLDSREIALTIQLYTRFMELSKELGLIEIKLTRGEKLSEDEKNKWNIRSQILENQELSIDNKFSFMLDLLFAEDSIRSQYEERYEQNKYDRVVAQVYGEVLEQDVEGRGGNEKLSDEERTDGVDVDDFKKLAEETIVTNPMGIPNVIEQIKGVFKGVRDKFLR